MFRTLYSPGNLRRAIFLYTSKSFYAERLGGVFEYETGTRQNELRPICFCFCGEKSKKDKRYFC
ncbi:MAG: hypothetical protein A2566_01260 [Candidatus Zambryskibacteria bacterium RIFOXYD1_FULL_40_13]|nr:MAG: hypothetical protein A2566_01260 [Candidatus Zambryskibacteria bacterium RIFOXYD1_FULL_40_13]HBO17632.1 hypothetical protein [Candidatus Zambryskibacteria bacterium]HCH59551.1 hypothetical protein [Candidatus Zambryskibacteria bacterium]